MTGQTTTTSGTLILALRQKFSASDWPWALLALRQDRCVWDALLTTDLGALAIHDLPSDPRQWTPAALGLLLVDSPQTAHDLAALPMPTLDETLRRRAASAWEGRTEAVASDLENAVLLALALREKYSENSTWRGLLDEMTPEHDELSTVVACLHGLVPEADQLLSALFAARLELGLHVFLCRPLPEDEQATRLAGFFTDLDAPARLKGLQLLAPQRPSLALRLAEAFASQAVALPADALDDPADLGRSLDHLAASVRRARTLELAGLSERAVPLLAESLRALRRLRGHLSAGLARTVAQARDDDQTWNETARETGLEAWKQAVQFAPETPGYLAGLINALRSAGRVEEARRFIGHYKQEIDHDPALALAAAQLAFTDGDRAEAVRWAQTSLRLAPAARHFSEADWIALCDLFASLEQAPQLLEAAGAGLGRFPLSIPLLQRAAPAQLASGRPQEALQAVLVAQVLDRQADDGATPSEAIAAAALQAAGYAPASPAADLQEVMIGALEMLGAWSQALDARLQRCPVDAITEVDELRAVMRCAELAGQNEPLEAVSRRIVGLAPEDVDAHRNLGAAAAARGDLDAAVEHYTTAVHLVPELPEAWLGLVNVYESSGQDARAFDALRRAAAAVPDSVIIHTRLGDAYRDRKEPTAALACFKRAAALDPSESVVLRLGETLVELGHYEDARRAVEPRVQDPTAAGTSTDLTYTYARALIGLGRAADAVPLLTEVVRRAPERVDPALDLSRALMQVPDQPAGAQAAIPFLQRILDLDPEGEAGGYSGRLDSAPAVRAESRALLAEAYAASGETQLAMDAFRLALDDPFNQRPTMQARLSAGLGQAALKLDQAEMAVAALQEAVQTEPLNAGLHRSLSEAYLASDLVKDSFQAADAALELEPEDPGLLQWFITQIERLAARPAAVHLPIRGRLLGALESISRIEPQRPDLLLRLGRARLEAGDRPGALDAFRRIAGTEERIPPEQVIEAVRAIRDLGDARLSVLILERALSQLDPDAPQPKRIALLGELSLSQQEAGEEPAALQSAETALGLNPADAGLQARVGDLHARGGRLEKALEHFQEAVRLEPRDPDLRRRAAEILRRRGRLTEALEMTERGLEVLPDPASDPEAELRQTLRLAAASLAQATLRPRRALSFLSADPGGEAAAASYPAAALQAEIALDLGDADLAAPAVETIQRLDGKSPRVNAARSRLARLRGNPEECDRCCRNALRGLLQQANQNPVTPTSTREEFIAASLSTAQAAIENRLWSDSRRVLNRLIELIPETPLAYFKLAQIDVLRGEAECLHGDLEVIRHGYGADALSDGTRRACEANLEQAQALLGVEFKLEISEDFNKWDDECRRTLGAWMARARALFQPDRRAARVLETMFRLTDAGPEEAAALILAYRRSGEAAMALNAVQVAWRPAFDQQDAAYTPLVLAHLALADPDPAAALGRAREALECALESPDRWPPMAMLEYLLARAALTQGAFPTAIQAIQRALAAWPDEPRWQAFAGRLYRLTSASDGLPDPVKALVHLEQAAVLQPEQVENHLAIGQIYLEGAQPARALPALERAAALAPQRPDIQFALARAQQAAGDLPAAALSAERASIGFSRDPEDAADDEGAGAQALKDPPAENRPALWEALLLRGRIALQTGTAPDALRQAETILKFEPNHPEALYLLAQALEVLDRPAEALAALDQAIGAHHSPLPMLLERIRLVNRSKGLDAGLAALQEQLELRPGRAELLALQADWLGGAGRVDEAVAAARQALLEEDGELDRADRARLHLLIGLQMRRSGQLDQAINHLSEAVNHAPEDLDAYLELGRAYQERREYRQALKVYQKAITVAGSDYRPYYQAGLVLKDSKDYIAAEAMLRRAAQVAPNEVSIHRLLGAVVALNLVHNRRISSPEA